MESKGYGVGPGDPTYGYDFDRNSPDKHKLRARDLVRV